MDNLRRARQKRGAGVHGDLALARAHADALQAVVPHAHLLHLDLPVALHGHRRPEDLRGHALAPVAAEGDLALLPFVAEENAKEALFQHTGFHQLVEHGEGRALGHLRERQAQDAVEGDQAERLVALLGRRHKVDLAADAARAQADVVPHVHSAHLPSAEGDRHDVSGAVRRHRLLGLVREGHLHRRRAEAGVVALVVGARVVAALLRGQEQVAAARVEDDEEALRRAPHADLAVVLGGLAGAAALPPSPAPALDLGEPELSPPDQRHDDRAIARSRLAWSQRRRPHLATGIGSVRLCEDEQRSPDAKSHAGARHRLDASVEQLRRHSSLHW
mmetsp:Transcript_110803/g.269303  ORF Transcript_110803/g.269303 Transcript_110803/m.269303 type:complete len:332 (+) Transcript_110803:444-1439(+)